jgi:hypothetical protein
MRTIAQIPIIQTVPNFVGVPRLDIKDPYNTEKEVYLPFFSGNSDILSPAG